MTGRHVRGRSEENEDPDTMTSIQRHGMAAVIATLLALTAAVGSAQAQATNLGTFNDWTAWQGTDANGMICYVSSQPTNSEPKNVNRDPIHFLVIHRKGLGTKNEVQTLIGYPFNSSNANATATVDGKAYPMVTEGAAAWLASTGDESGFVAALKAGSQLVVRGTSQRGTNTTDTYSLRGVTAAMTEIDKACA
jgi:hypothetical protein